jgi:CRP/FNR family nitrogen fixation transcriptional regulator
MFEQAVSPVAANITIVPVGHAAARGPLAGAFAVLGYTMTFDRDSEIFGEMEIAEFFYEVVSGAVRSYKLLSDGRRQIAAFHLPGDVFGIEAGDTHAFSAEAIGETVLRVAARSAVLGLAARDPSIGTDLWTHTAGALRAAQEHMLLLGRKTAEERVLTFLADMAHRTSNSRIVELPMTRQDIADHLGLTIETVSRTLTLLETRHAIELPSCRKIILCEKRSLPRAA